MRSLLALPFLLWPFTTYAQECPKWQGSADPLHELPEGIELYLGGPTGIASVDLSDLLYRNGLRVPQSWKIHAGIGFTGVDLGLAYEFPTQSRHLCFYAGADVAYISGKAALDLKNMHPVLFAPLGCRYVFRNGFSLGGALMPCTSKELNYCWAGLRISYFFWED